MDKKKMNDIERELLEGMEEFVTDLKGDEPIKGKYTCRRMVLDLQPQTYGPAEVKATRLQLRVSQSMFAQFLGVSPKTVRAWEQGKPVSKMACRFMDEVGRNPEYWRKRIRNSIKTKTC
jgi:putative transcriptional regulator